jgi:uncharacterized protein (UPF0276 family)
MNLAINYSMQAAALLSEGRIQIDRFKTPGWPGMIDEARKYCPVAVHFALEAGSDRLRETDWGEVDRIRAVTGTPYVNIHLAGFAKAFPDLPRGPLAPHEAVRVADRLVEDVALVARRFGPMNVIVENVPYRGPGDKVLPPAVEPAVICRVLKETDCGLLLDISHAGIAAHHLGMDPYEYLDQLPVERLREMHFTGVKDVSGRLTDHLEPQEADWQALEGVMTRIHSGEWLLAFEYGGVGEKFAQRSRPDVIAASLPRLWGMVKG